MSANRLCPAQRRLAGRIGAAVSWANETDRTRRTDPARAAADARFLKLADPDGVMAPKARRAKAEQLRKEFYARIQLRSAQVRAMRRRGGQGPSDV